MVLNQTLGLNALRQDLNRLFYSAPIAQNGYGQNGLYAPNAFFVGASPMMGQQSFMGQPGYMGQQAHAAQQSHFVPKANIAETPDAVIIAVELPGVELGQVSLLITGNVLVLEGVRQPGGLLGNQMVNYQAAEGRFGAFRWICPIPNGVIAPQIESILSNGLLTIVLPKVTVHTGFNTQNNQAWQGQGTLSQGIFGQGVQGQAIMNQIPMNQIGMNQASLNQTGLGQSQLGQTVLGQGNLGQSGLGSAPIGQIVITPGVNA